MFDTLARPIKERLLKPSAEFIGRYVSPNFITVLAFAVGLATIVTICFQAPKIALLLWLLNRILDGLDGTVARVTNRQSDFGGYIDIMTDFVIYAGIPIALSWTYASQYVWPSLAILLAMFYVNAASWMYLSALIEKNRINTSEEPMTSVPMPGGLVEGSETLVFFTAFIILPDQIALLFTIMSIAIIPGIISRIIWAHKALRAKDIK